MNSLTLIFLTLWWPQSWAQNFYSQRIQKIGLQPQESVFTENGVLYHNGNNSTPTKLQRVRNHYSASLNRERLVFDFDGGQIPQTYGHWDSANKKLYLSLFNAHMQNSSSISREGAFVEDIKLFLMKKGLLDVEISFKSKVSLDIFHLPSPGRLVVDVTQ